MNMRPMLKLALSYSVYDVLMTTDLRELKARIKINKNFGGRHYQKVKSLIFLKRNFPMDKISLDV